MVLSQATLGHIGGVFIASMNAGWNSAGRGFCREFYRPGPGQRGVLTVSLDSGLGTRNKVSRD